MKPAAQHRTSQREKGKARQLDAVDVLAQLNELLESLLIPIHLPDLSVVTSSLLLAVIESILERRFLALDDSTRTSRSLQSRSNCLKLIINALSKYLNPIEHLWSPEAINLPQLVDGDPNEVVKLIDGLVKLSKLPVFSRHRKQKSQNPTAHHQEKLTGHHPGKRTDQATSSTHRTTLHQRASSKRVPTTNQFTSLSSNWSSLSSDASKIPFDGLSSPGGPRFDESSLRLPSRAGSTTSSNSNLARSINRNQNDYELPPSGQLSNPPTLRNLLGPLQAQMISSKRPQSPRTAHRVMVNKLRNEGGDEEIQDQILNHDTDASLSTNIETEEDDETFEEESPHQYPKGSGMMTLDGIEPDDPFVSMETRRAMESQLLQNQTTATFDFTQWAVTGNDSHSRSLHYNAKQQQPPTDWKQQPTLRSHSTRSHSSRSAISSYSASSHHVDEFVPFSNQDLQPVLTNTLPSPKSQTDDRIYGFDTSAQDESSFASHQITTNGTDYGFGRARIPSYSSGNDFLLPNPSIPSSIPLPPSPSPSFHEHSQNQSLNPHKVFFASEGAQLNLIVADVIKYEREKENEASKMENSDWSDAEKIAEESEHLRPISPSTSFLLSQKPTSAPSAKLNLIARKLELLKLLNQAYNNSNQDTNRESDDAQVTAERTGDNQDRSSHHDHEELEKIMEKENQEKNVRIRVTRNHYDGIHQKHNNHDFHKRANMINNNHRLIILSRYNLLPNFPSSSNQSLTSDSSTTRSSSFNKNKFNNME